MRAPVHVFTSDRLAAVVLAVLFTAYGYAGGSIPPALEADVVGPGFFPKIVAVLGVLLAVLLFVQSAPEEQRGGGLEVAALVPVAALLAYALALEYVGFAPATVVFLTLTMKYLGCPGWTRAVVLALVATACTVALFEYGLELSLPRGTLMRA